MEFEIVARIAFDDPLGLVWGAKIYIPSMWDLDIVWESVMLRLWRGEF